MNTKIQIYVSTRCNLVDIIIINIIVVRSPRLLETFV